MDWSDPSPVVVPEALARSVGGHPLVAQRLAGLGIADEAGARGFLDPRAYRLTSPLELPGMERAVERLGRAIRARESILIWGDFDVDGQTATALLLTALRELGADVRCHVPLRGVEGHGVDPGRLREWIGRGVRLIVTCDTGITAYEALAIAAAAGVDVIVTDHHLPGERLPEAVAVVNPMLLPPGHRLRELPGVGAAWSLIAALGMGSQCEDLLDLVALGIVADVAVQRNDTRCLLQRGLDLLRLTRRPGLRALIATAEVDPLHLDERDVGFALGPRLNAQGRLGDARDAVELLSTEDPVRAAELAAQLGAVNARRRLESRLVEQSAHAILTKDPSLLEYAVIVIAHPEWAGGVVGIVANRLAELWRRPVVLLGEKGGQLSGSARSVSGCNITEAIGRCGGLVRRYGGHAMAAGLSLAPENLFEFRRQLSIIVRGMLDDRAERPLLPIDGLVSPGEMTLDLAQDLRRLAPFGNGNPPLTLVARDLRLVRRRRLGRHGDHLELLVEDTAGSRHRALWWNAREPNLPSGRFSLAFHPEVSRFGGEPELVLEVVDLRPDQPLSINNDSNNDSETTVQGPQIEDCRALADPVAHLTATIAATPDVVVWREADESVAGLRRHELHPARLLVVWTEPPGPEELERALDQVAPLHVIFYGRRPPELSPEVFLQRLGGLVKYAIARREGLTTIPELAAALAQRDEAVRLGLRWLAATGGLMFTDHGDGSLTLARTANPPQRDPRPIEALLRQCLDETSAYRRRSIAAD